MKRTHEFVFKDEVQIFEIYAGFSIDNNAILKNYTKCFTGAYE
jgi:hypothetical protein